MFKVGAPYSRKDVLHSLGIPDAGGGAWYTGLVAHGGEHYIFCGVGVAGRTGHDYSNRFDGPDLVWFGKTGSRRGHESIQSLLTGRGVHVFYREDNRSPFTYAGVGRPCAVVDSVPVQIRWSFRNDTGPHPEYLPEEIGDEPCFEGARRTVTVDVYERDPTLRARCVRHWGPRCAVCSFDFEAEYGELGEGYIHVHHLRPLSEIGLAHVVDPVEDLRPVCPNCHAMLHRRRPALTIDRLSELRRAAKARAEETSTEIAGAPEAHHSAR